MAIKSFWSDILKVGSSVAIAALLAAALITSAKAQTIITTKQQSFDQRQEQDIESIVQRYLLEHPEAVYQALVAWQNQQEQAEKVSAQQNITPNAQALFNNASDPVFGNPDGDVVMVEFFDYRCGYCKRVAGGLMDMLAKDGNVKLVMKEFPILGPDSVVAARAALAARKQGKYNELHMALINSQGALNEKIIMKIAGSIGLDTKQLKTDMNDPVIQQEIAQTRALAQKLKINGTPAFVFADQIVPGAISPEQMLQHITRIRQING
ncbi:DsbA family protein [Alphaproteobacteria bacterium]|nr:DsbA family protein [Alphaproteobacteria bacterium]